MKPSRRVHLLLSAAATVLAILLLPTPTIFAKPRPKITVFGREGVKVDRRQTTWSSLAMCTVLTSWLHEGGAGDGGVGDEEAVS